MVQGVSSEAKRRLRREEERWHKGWEIARDGAPRRSGGAEETMTVRKRSLRGENDWDQGEKSGGGLRLRGGSLGELERLRLR